MVTIRTELPSDVVSRERLLDKAFGKTRVRKTSERLREGRLPADGLAFTALDAKGRVIGTAAPVVDHCRLCRPFAVAWSSGS